MSQSLQRGFTLIEILIAMTILFMALATGMMAFQNSQTSNDRAMRVVELLAQVEPIVATIATELQPTQPQGQGVEDKSGAGTLLGVSYQWQAVPRTREFGIEAAQGSRSNERDYVLYEVSLVLTKEGIERDFNYVELVWRNVSGR